MRHYIELDSIRAVAVILVIAHHYMYPTFPLGALGVDIFFVLSGYLITSLLAREWQEYQEIKLSHFYLKRILRLYPALLLTLVFVSPFESRANILFALFYVANWSTAFQIVPNEKHFLFHIWSLSIEEQFYFAWPLLLVFALRRGFPSKKLWLIPLTLSLLSTLERIILFLAGAEIQRIARGTDSHSDGLFLGCTLALVVAFPVEWPRAARLGLKFLTGAGCLYTAGLFLGFIPEKSLYLGGNFLFSLTAAFVIFCVVSRRVALLNRVLSNRPMAAIGKVSYGLYLYHFPILLFAGLTGIHHGISLLFTFLFSFFSFRYFESPILSLKRHLHCKTRVLSNG